MSLLPTLVFDPILPVSATGADLINHPPPPRHLIPTDHLTRGESTTADQYAAQPAMTIGTRPTTPNGSFLDTSKEPSSHLQQQFIQLLSTWTVSGSSANGAVPQARCRRHFSLPRQRLAPPALQPRRIMDRLPPARTTQTQLRPPPTWLPAAH
jgi:hypothetical protein